ncbi:MAG: hybrid sensor histidine kinase/response regulator [Bacteroidetes bacterium]|nr:hybrid sensor histidine kinase/response regulator [Bacteroidota bacterium]
MDKKQEFQKRILATFRIEAQENITTMSAYLIELENEPPDSRKEELFEVLYRTAHSLKGASRAVGFTDIESLCHGLENVMAAIRSNEIDFNSQVFDVLFQTSDLIEEVLNTIEGEPSEELSDKISKQVDNLSLTKAGLEVEVQYSRTKPPVSVLTTTEPIVPAKKEEIVTKEIKKETETTNYNADKLVEESTTASRKITDDSIHVSTKKLDVLLMQAEEMLSLKLIANQRTKDLQNTLNELMLWSKKASEVYDSSANLKRTLDFKKSINSGFEKEITDIFQFCEWSGPQIKNIEKNLSDILSLAHQESYSTNSKIETLLEDVKELITLPFSTLLDGFPKMVRDISKDLGKKIKFEVLGDSVEIDRRILEQIRNPLIHILRNSIDYGIEDPKTRIENNKKEKGNITLKIEQLENNKVELTISDDGAGIDLNKLKQVYIKNEEIEKNDVEKIEEKELLKYIFRSGVTTSTIVTDLSGRGLGMAITQETIEHLGGTIQVKTEKGKSTTFTILLPLTIVTYRGVIIELSNRQFIVPTQKVHSVIRVAASEIETVGNKATFSLNDEIIPLINLSEILELNSTQISGDVIQIIIFDKDAKKIGFIIDKVVGEQEVLVKKFNKQLTRVRNILGASILGSGEVVPILNISDLYKSSLNTTESNASVSKDSESETEQQKSILIVEDSITSRTLLKNILETSGYKVTTAIDGVDGFTKLKEGTFDAVVTDVEMPRMNGFELTAKIRSLKDSANMPIVLVTSLSKREDREKGIDVGANAYIIKSSFDQSNLLEVLERLI